MKNRVVIYSFWFTVVYIINFLITYFFRSISIINSDFYNYNDALTLSIEDISSFYYLKEPGLWFIQKILYTFTGDQFLAWALIDFFLMGVVFYVAYIKNIKPVFILFYYLSFYSILGQSIYYRQFIAITIFAWLGLNLSIYRYSIIAGLFHWVGFLGFLRLIFYSKFFYLIVAMLSIFILDIIFLDLYTLFGFDVFYSNFLLLMSDRLTFESGAVVTKVYLAIILFLFLGFYVKTKEISFLFGCLFSLIIFLFLDGTIIQRILIAIIQLMIPYALTRGLEFSNFMKVFYAFSILANFFHPNIINLLAHYMTFL